MTELAMITEIDINKVINHFGYIHPPYFMWAPSSTKYNTVLKPKLNYFPNLEKSDGNL